MKNIKYFSLAIACSALLISCGNKKPTFDDIVVKDAELAISTEDMSVLDSIADELRQTEDKTLTASITTGLYNLNDIQKREKPDNLMPLSTVNKAKNNIDKVRMLAVLVAERNISRAFDLPYESYNELITKVSTDLNFPIYTKALSEISVEEAIEKEKETVAKQYQAMKKNGTEELFWAYKQTQQIEIFYLLSTQPDILLKLLNEETIDINCKRSIRLLQAQEIMGKYFEDINNVNKLQFAAKELNTTFPSANPTNKDLYDFLVSNQEQIAQVRAKILGI